MDNPIHDQKEVFQSDYDAEWGLDDDSPQEEAVDHSEDDEKTLPEEAATEGEAQGESKVEGEGADMSKAAEPENEDPYAGLSEKHIEAIRKAERDEKAMRGRYKLAEDRATQLERELAEERQRLKALEEANRKPSQFEQDHPEYYKALKEEFGKAQPSAAPSTTKKDPVELILESHSDAGELYNSADFQAWVADQPGYVRKALDSDSAEDVIEALDFYKTTLSTVPETENSLESIVEPSGSKGKPDLRRQSDLSAQEAYDLEWEQDD